MMKNDKMMFEEKKRGGWGGERRGGREFNSQRKIEVIKRRTKII